MRRTLLFIVIAIVLFGAFKFYQTYSMQTRRSSFQLCDHCPPGFEQTADNRCKLSSMYQQFSSLKGKGVGGLQTALPEMHDGFSPQQIDLGRYLFFDPVLSADNSLSCAGCHKPEMGFADGLAHSVGINHRQLKRSAPTLWNVGFLNSFFWDARASSMEEQMSGPLFSPSEMGSTPEKLLAKLNNIDEYRQLFSTAFPGRKKDDTISMLEVCRSLAAFESSLVSLNSRYDHYAMGYHEALSAQEIEGLNIFRSFVARCAECHTPPLFTNQQIAVLGTPEPEGLPLDIGAEKTFRDSTMRAGFKVPTLRNIDKTAPYMHSGVFATLREAVDFYNKGRGHAVPKGEKLYLHWHIWDPKLTDYEIDRVVDFLKTLDDETFTPQVPAHVPSGLKETHTLSAYNQNKNKTE